MVSGNRDDIARFGIALTWFASRKMNIAEIILSNGAESAPAILYRNTVVTYGKLRQMVAEIAELCGRRAGAPGQRIGIFSENNSFSVAAYLGIIDAGMVAVPFQTEIGPEKFGSIIASAGITLIFCSSRFEKKIKPWAEAMNCRVETAETIMQNLGGEGETPHRQYPQPGQVFTGASGPGGKGIAISEHGNPDAGLPGWGSLVTEASETGGATNKHAGDGRLAALMFTSGSTGAPKGVMVTHRNIECNSRDIIEYMGLSAGDRCMMVLPFHYCFGLSLLHTHLMTGGCLVLNNDFRLYPETVLKEMQETQCTGIAGVPSTYQILLRKSRFKQMSFPKLRWFQQAGGKLPNACIEELRSAFPQVRFYLMYGQTEATARLSYLPPERLADKLGSIGKGLASTRLEVLRPDGAAVKPAGRQNTEGKARAGDNAALNSQRSTLNSQPLAEGEIGEIVASGDNIALGYWNDPEETGKYFKNGKLYTGDLARVDEEGFIYIVERERDMIKAGGNRVSGKEIEEVITELQEVVETAVVGVPHELLGEAVHAFVVLRPESKLSESDVLAYCRKRLPGFKIPEKVFFRNALPHNSAGKVMKRELRFHKPRQSADAIQEAGVSVPRLAI